MADSNGHDKVAVDTTETAIVVRIASQAGQRAIEMQFGVPLNMNLAQLNAYMDKATSVIDRQIAIGDLRRAKMDLEGAKKAAFTQQEQKAAYMAKMDLDWVAGGRKGPFRPAPSQQAQLDNWDKSLHELRDNRIPHFQAEITKLEQDIAAGG